MKLISINIEAQKHLDRVIPFIKVENPDVLCLQEVCDCNLQLFASLGYTGEFLPSSMITVNDNSMTYGTALLSKHSMKNFLSYYFRGSKEAVRAYKDEEILCTQQKALLFASVLINGETYNIATTHFTWALNGRGASPEQIIDMEKFLHFTSTLEPHILCGDFNTSRQHSSLYKSLLLHYTDTIPDSYTSSLDRTYHRVGNDPTKQYLFDSLMIDYVFTQPPYKATDVRLQFGLSDHAGIVATITK